MMKIWLCNLGKYNEGNLVGQWIDLPVDDFRPILDNIGINEEYEEYFIADWECDFYKVHEYDNIYLLNYLAKLSEKLDEGEIAELKLAASEMSVTDIYEMINLILQLDNLNFIWLPGEGDAYTELGEMFAEIDGLSNKLEELGVIDYFDFEKYGKSLSWDYAFGDDNVILNTYSVKDVILDRYSYDEIKEMMEE